MPSYAQELKLLDITGQWFCHDLVTEDMGKALSSLSLFPQATASWKAFLEYNGEFIDKKEPEEYDFSKRWTSRSRNPSANPPTEPTRLHTGALNSGSFPSHLFPPCAYNMRANLHLLPAGVGPSFASKTFTFDRPATLEIDGHAPGMSFLPAPASDNAILPSYALVIDQAFVHFNGSSFTLKSCSWHSDPVLVNRQLLGDNIHKLNDGEVLRFGEYLKNARRFKTECAVRVRISFPPSPKRAPTTTNWPGVHRLLDGLRKEPEHRRPGRQSDSAPPTSPIPPAVPPSSSTTLRPAPPPIKSCGDVINELHSRLPVMGASVLPPAAFSPASASFSQHPDSPPPCVESAVAAPCAATKHHLSSSPSNVPSPQYMHAPAHPVDAVDGEQVEQLEQALNDTFHYGDFVHSSSSLPAKDNSAETSNGGDGASGPTGERNALPERRTHAVGSTGTANIVPAERTSPSRPFGPRSTSVVPSGLSSVPIASCPGSTASSDSTTSPAVGIAKDPRAQSSTPSGFVSVAGSVKPPCSSVTASISSIKPLPSARHSDAFAGFLPSAEKALQRVGQALLQARVAASGMATAVLAIERMRAAWRTARGAVDSVAVLLVLSADGLSSLRCPTNSVLNNRAHCAGHDIAPGSSSSHSPLSAFTDGRSLSGPTTSSFYPWLFPFTSPQQPQHHPAADAFTPCVSWPWIWPPSLPLCHHIGQPAQLLFPFLYSHLPALAPIHFH